MRAIPELQEGRLYDLLEATGEYARSCVRRLVQEVEEGHPNPLSLDEFVQASAARAEAIRSHLLRANMVSLPKAELGSLVAVLTAIPLNARRFAARFELATNAPDCPDFLPALNWIAQLGDLVLDMVRQLRGFESLDHLKELNLRLQTVADHAEAGGDAIHASAYRSNVTALRLLLLKDLADSLNTLIECHREAGKIMARISFHFF